MKCYYRICTALKTFKKYKNIRKKIHRPEEIHTRLYLNFIIVDVENTTKITSVLIQLYLSLFDDV